MTLCLACALVSNLILLHNHSSLCCAPVHSAPRCRWPLRLTSISAGILGRQRGDRGCPDMQGFSSCDEHIGKWEAVVRACLYKCSAFAAC